MRSLSKNAKAIVRERIENEIADPSGAVPQFDIFVVWSCKTLQNSKALVSASLKEHRILKLR